MGQAVGILISPGQGVVSLNNISVLVCRMVQRGFFLFEMIRWSPGGGCSNGDYDGLITVTW